MKVEVLPIKSEEAAPWILTKHYAKRMCPISYAFGAYASGVLVGVVTYGTPVSSSLRVGVCGNDWQGCVLELNRLCCESEKNLASTLVGRSLAMLPKPSVVVSFADTAMGHIGYIYQATNFVYTGLSAKRTDWTIKGMEHLHGATVADMSRGHENRAAFMREKFGSDFYLKDRARKHRYVFFVGSAKQKKEMLAALKYPVAPYPKGLTSRYFAGGSVSTQGLLLHA